MDSWNVTGEYLRYASKGVDEHGGPAVHFSFNSRGERILNNSQAQLTKSSDGGTSLLGNHIQQSSDQGLQHQFCNFRYGND